MPSFAPKIRVEVYLPVRNEPPYQKTLSWLIAEFTQMRGGCTVNENAGGYYLSQSNEVIEDRVSVVYIDFPMNWDKPPERTDVVNYCATLKSFIGKTYFSVGMPAPPGIISDMDGAVWERTYEWRSRRGALVGGVLMLALGVFLWRSKAGRAVE